MSIMAAYPPDAHDSGVLELAVTLAQARYEDLVVVTVVPPRWSTPSMARVDAEFGEWAAQQADAASRAAHEVIDRLAPDLSVMFHRIDGRSAAAALADLAVEDAASFVVIGSSDGGSEGRIQLGSTGDRLAHSARIPVAVAPRGYRAPAGGFARLTCAIGGISDDETLIAQAYATARSAGVPFRLVTFAVRRETMHPAETGYDAEDEVALAVREQADAAFVALRRRGLIGGEVQTLVGMGPGWRASVESLGWLPDELIVIGSHSHSALARVFLGSSATKIVRHSPVPVALLPA